MTELTEQMNATAAAAHAVLARIDRMKLVLPSVEQHLLVDQADAIAAPARSAWEAADAPQTHSGQRDTGKGAAEHTEPPTDIGHSDPTPKLAARIGWFHKRRQNLRDATRGIDRAIAEVNRQLDHAERVCRASTSVKPGAAQVDEPRCPGWTPELQARLGGCGKIPETYDRGNGTTGERRYCAGCRKAEQREQRLQNPEVA